MCSFFAAAFEPRLTEDGKLLTQIVVEGNLADGP